MGLKNWLWNDNARELFRARDASGDDAAQPSQGKDQARKLAKGSAAFTSALLFGTNESQGLLAARAGRNPQTGAELQIPASTVPAFKAD